MPEVTFRLLGGGERRVAYGQARDNLSDLARRHDIPGAAGECGGLMACATCHVYIAEEWRARIGPPSDHEAEMLAMGEAPCAESRLGCQIWLTPEMDGLLVEVAPD